MGSQRVTLLGATGAVGKAATDFLSANRTEYEIVAITGNRNVARLKEIALLLEPEWAVIADEAQWGELRGLFSTLEMQGLKTKIAAGQDALIAAASHKVDKVLAAIVGAAGLKPTLAAAATTASIALANKECLIMAGNFFIEAAKEILPVDSEHNAIFQVLSGKPNEIQNEVHAIVLTSSGGPFRNLTRNQMVNITPEQAIKHPNWTMGNKISIDSATMMNKALELIEAQFLFAIPSEKLKILIHPEQIIHSMVQFCDGSTLAQMGVTDMYLPVAYTFSYPNRLPAAPKYHLNFTEIAQLNFSPPNHERFPLLNLVRNVMQAGQEAAIIFNAANEVAVENFCQRKIPYLAIADIIADSLAQSHAPSPKNIEDVLDIDQQTRRLTKNICTKYRL